MSGNGDAATFFVIYVSKNTPVLREFINTRLEETKTDTVDRAWFVEYMDRNQHVVLGETIERINKLNLRDFPLHPNTFTKAETINRGILTLVYPDNGTKMMTFVRSSPRDKVSIRLYHGAFIDMSRTVAMNRWQEG